MRRLEVHLRDGAPFDTVLRAIKHFEPIDYFVAHPETENRRVINVLMRDGSSQALVDSIQSILEEERDWRLTVFAIEATIPQIEAPAGDKKEVNTQAIREELLADVAKGSVFDRDFAVLVALSTVVAAVGMNSGSVAGVIGAMVIAPLLGPILAFAMGAALGDLALLKRAGATLSAGVCLALTCGAALAVFMPLDLQSSELTSRAEVRLDGVALALAAGGAAALSVAKGQSSGLVGVMVAAALLPPGAAMGLFFGAGEVGLGARAGILLLLNVACLILAALITFRLRKIKPRSWIEQKNASSAVRLNYALWAVCLAVIGGLIFWFDLGARVSFID